MKQTVQSFHAILRILLINIIAFSGFMIVAPPLALAADNNVKSSACEGLELTGGSCDNENTPTNQTAKSKINSIIKTVINIFSLIVGFVSVLMIMIGGFKYVTSSGDSNSTASAKNTILYAIIGLVIVALAQIIVQFVLGKV